MEGQGGSCWLDVVARVVRVWTNACRSLPGEPTEAEAQADPDDEGADSGTAHEADMDEPDDAEQTTEQY